MKRALGPHVWAMRWKVSSIISGASQAAFGGRLSGQDDGSDIAPLIGLHLALGAVGVGHLHDPFQHHGTDADSGARGGDVSDTPSGLAKRSRSALAKLLQCQGHHIEGERPPRGVSTKLFASAARPGVTMPGTITATIHKPATTTQKRTA